MFLSPEQVIDRRKEDDRAIYQDVPIHVGRVGMGRRREERQYEEEYQENHRDDIYYQAPPAQVELGLQQGSVSAPAPYCTSD